MHVEERSVVVQYSNWENGQPQNADRYRCVLITQSNYWITYDCSRQQRYVCQS